MKMIFNANNVNYIYIYDKEQDPQKNKIIINFNLMNNYTPLTYELEIKYKDNVVTWANNNNMMVLSE